MTKCDRSNPEDGCVFECGCKNGGTCNQNTGNCTCSPGFTGDICQLQCPEGTFGQNCELKCDCMNENGCDPVTGKCVCIGFAGEKCRTPCQKNYYGLEVRVFLSNFDFKIRPVRVRLQF